MMKSRKLLGVAVLTCISGAVFGAGFQLYTEGSAEALGRAGGDRPHDRVPVQRPRRLDQRPVLHRRRGTGGATPKILSSGVTEARFPTILAQGNDLHVAFARRETAEEQYAYYTHFKPDSGWSSPVDTTMDNPVIINTNVPFVLNSTMAYCNNRLYLYYDGALAPNGKERILGANNASGWLPRDEANNGLLRSIRPSMVCMDGELHIAFDIVVQPDVDHQIYYLNNGVVTGDGSDGSVALPIILKK